MDLTYIVLCGGLSTRNYPHSKGIAHKSLLPFGSLRIIDYVLKEIFASGGKEIVFVCSNEKAVAAFKEAFKPAPAIERKLRENPKTKKIADVLKTVDIPSGIRIRYAIQKHPKGNAHAFGTGYRLAKGKNAVMIFPDDLYIHENAKDSHMKKAATAFSKNKKQILLTGIEREDVTNYGTLIGGRLVEKPAHPENNIGLFSPMFFPKELCAHILKITDAIDKGKKVAEMNGKKECIYTEAVNTFLDQNKDFNIKTFAKSEKSVYLDTGTLPLYEQAMLYMLTKHSAFQKDGKIL